MTFVKINLQLITFLTCSLSVIENRFISLRRGNEYDTIILRKGREDHEVGKPFVPFLFSS
jgi:hypothetical protein